MTRHTSRRRLMRTLGAGAVAGFAGCTDVLGGESPAEQARSHRDALSKYTDVGQANQDGYLMTTPYVRTEDGVLGMPFFNRDAPELDPEQPTILYYNLTADGGFNLLGAEWLVPTENADSPPSMFGKELEGPTPGETALIPEHYGLRVWLFEENPEGLFERYHSSAEPPPFIDGFETAWEALTPYYSGAKAEENGYTNTEECIETEDGGYGVPFVNPDYAGTDISKPAVLLYRLTSSWTYQILGAEWYVPTASVDDPPSMFGKEFHDSREGHSPKADQPEHYGLHVWLFNANPGGVFATHNPTLSCQ